MKVSLSASEKEDTKTRERESVCVYMCSCSVHAALTHHPMSLCGCGLGPPTCIPPYLLSLSLSPFI